MGPITKTWFFSLLVITALIVQDASALPGGDDPLSDGLLDAICGIHRTPAGLGCEVYENTSGAYADRYIYTYQISNINSDAGLGSFSVAIWDGANVLGGGYRPPVYVAAPKTWPVVGSPPQSADALLTNPIRGYSPARTSTVLSFVGDYAPTLGNRTLLGATSNMPRSAAEDLLAPTPQPATLGLLGTCRLVTVAQRM